MRYQGARRATGGEFRPDLEGLRGIAILLVLLFHAKVPGTDGGFVGVDVFFVLSGFLITGLLIRERERTGRIDLKAFYIRRVRRILPAATVVLAITMVFAWFLMAPLDLPRVAGDAVASALSVGNIRFAAGATDYFGTDLAPSPVIHYWSLGVEEQFYLLWPAVLILATRSRRPRVAAGIVLAALAITSYAAAYVLTDAAPGWAFYSLPTRAWQLGLGGLIAVGADRIARLSPAIAVPLGWAGLAAVLASLVVITPGTSYPGVAALLPTLGSAAVIVAGEQPWSVAKLLAVAPLRCLGRISYSLYLVHWPILVLPAATLEIGQQLPLEVRLGLVALSVVAGWASYRFVEQPIHRGVRFRAPAGRTFAVAGAAIALVVVLSGSLGVAASAQMDGGDPGTATVTDPTFDPGASVEPDPTETAAAPTASSPSGTPAPTPSGETPAPTAQTSPTPAPTPDGPQPLPANVKPSLGNAASDSDQLEADGCLLGQPQIQLRNCVYGNKSGSYTVALVGDSHAAQWFPAIQAIAVDRGWKLLPYIKLSCRFIDMSLYSYWYQRTYTECDTWRGLVVDKLKQVKPDLVIVIAIRDRVTSTAADADPVHQGQAMARLVGQLPGAKAIMVDAPVSKYNVPACISGHRSDVRPCQTSRARALSANTGIPESTAATILGATLIDLTPLICPGDPCPVVKDGMIVYRDSWHLTATFVMSLRGPLEQALLPAIK